MRAVRSDHFRMRILFICGCLQPVKDGVGDYVRSLAAAFAADGHDCAMLSLRDYFITEPVESSEIVGQYKVPALRLPATTPWAERIRRAREFRDRFRPDWQSLQFVLYAFQDKGIVWNVNAHFQRLFAGVPLHIMFHEAWIGMDHDASLRHRVTGVLQRASIDRMVKLLKPDLVTTSNPAYIAALKTIGVSAFQLPLFSNIPISNAPLSAELQSRLAGVGVASEDRSHWMLGLFFGVLYQFKPEPFMNIVRRAAAKGGKKLCLISLGRLGAVGEQVWQQLQRDYPGITYLTLGEQSPESVSAVMQAVDFGIAASHWQVIGKSGTATAMIEHGLPVIVTREDYRFRFPNPELPSEDPLFHRCDDSLEDKLVAGLPKRAPHLRRDDIAAQLCSMLEKRS
jgi:hypothetical protein